MIRLFVERDGCFRCAKTRVGRKLLVVLQSNLARHAIHRCWDFSDSCAELATALLAVFWFHTDLSWAAGGFGYIKLRIRYQISREILRFSKFINREVSLLWSPQAVVIATRADENNFLQYSSHTREVESSDLKWKMCSTVSLVTWHVWDITQTYLLSHSYGAQSIIQSSSSAIKSECNADNLRAHWNSLLALSVFFKSQHPALSVFFLIHVSLHPSTFHFHTQHNVSESTATRDCQRFYNRKIESLTGIKTSDLMRKFFALFSRSCSYTFFRTFLQSNIAQSLALHVNELHHNGSRGEKKAEKVCFLI